MSTTSPTRSRSRSAPALTAWPWWRRPVWLGQQGVENISDPNLGGTVEFDWGWVKLVQALHSSTTPDGRVTYASGLVINIGGTTVYHLGDTCLFGDLRLIAERTPVDVALIPIGGHYTMDRHDAVVAAELIGAGHGDPVPLQHVPADPDRRRAPSSQTWSRRPARRSWCSSPGTRTRSSQLAGAREHGIDHLLGELARERVLLARVKAAEERVRADRHLRAVAELRLGPRHLEAGAAQRRPAPRPTRTCRAPPAPVRARGAAARARR